MPLSWFETVVSGLSRSLQELINFVFSLHDHLTGVMMTIFNGIATCFQSLC